MAEITIYILQALYIFASASLIGYPLYRKVYRTTEDGADLIRLVCFSFGFGAAILFFAGLAISYAPFGRGALAIAATAILPVWIVYSYRADFIKLKAEVNGLFVIWAFFCAVTLLLSFSIIKISTYPGLISGMSGLADQIEYSQIAHTIFSKGEYAVPYFILDFSNNPQELKQSADNHQLLSHVRHRLPFTPYLISVYLNVFNRSYDQMLHSVLMIALVLYSAMLTGVLFTWFTAIGESAVSENPKRYYALSLISVACLYTIFPQEFLIGCFEIITLYYLLMLWALFCVESRFGVYQTVAAFLVTTALFFNKGEGAAAIACFALVIVTPKMIKARAGQGLKTAVSYALFLVLFTAAVSPWILGSMKQKVASNFSFLQYQVDCDGKTMVIDYSWFLEYINEKYGLSINRCDPLFSSKSKEELSRRAPDTSHLSDYKANTLIYHLNLIRLLKKNIYLFSYMMGSQADLYTRPPITRNDPSQDKTEFVIKSVKYLLNKSKEQIKSTVSFIGWRLPMSSAGSTLAYVLFGAPWNLVILWSAFLLVATATFLYPRIYSPPLAFFILFSSILILLNAGVIYRPRFMMMYSPVLFLAMILVFAKVKITSKTTMSRAKYTALAIIVFGLTIQGLFVETQNVKTIKQSESHFKRIAEVIKKVTKPDSIIVSSLPQFISGLTGRQAIGHSQFSKYLSGLTKNFRPEYILFYKRPDFAPDPDLELEEYRVGESLYKKPEFYNSFEKVWDDPVRKFILFKKKAGHNVTSLAIEDKMEAPPKSDDTDNINNLNANY